MDSFKAGDTFLIGGLGGNRNKLHCYVILCDPTESLPTFLAVPFNTLISNSDTTLVLKPGDHPFIVRETSVSYNLIKEFQVSQVSALRAMNGELFQPHTPVTPELLTRIIKGVLLSDETEPRMERMLKERLGIHSVDDL